MSKVEQLVEQVMSEFSLRSLFGTIKKTDTIFKIPLRIYQNKEDIYVDIFEKMFVLYDWDDMSYEEKGKYLYYRCSRRVKPRLIDIVKMKLDRKSLPYEIISDDGSVL